MRDVIELRDSTFYGIELVAVFCGSDLSVTIIGGVRPHVGAVALGCGILPDGSVPQYSATVSSLTVMDHKDDVIARWAAKYLADQWKGNVTVTVGIHVEDAAADDLQAIQESCKMLCEKLVNQYCPEK